jgi:hypothetical protein
LPVELLSYIFNLVESGIEVYLLGNESFIYKLKFWQV